MKILITGGAGFLGGHTARQLLDQGHEVILYDNLSKNDASHNDPRAEFVKGDISDQALLEKTLPGCDAVIHMASLIDVNESTREPLLYAQNNILGTISLLEAMRSVGVKKIIFSSSCVVYGAPKTLPLTEDSPVLAANPYGATKASIENFLNTYHFVHGFDVTLLRYFNPYGPDEHHEPETHAIPNFIKAGLEHRAIPLYWKGEQIRDFIFVEDLAAAHIAVLDLSGWNVFNVGTEKGAKIIDVVKTLSEIFGYELEIEDKGERPGDVPALYASSIKLHEATGWEAKVELKEGLRRTVEWFRTH